MRNHLGVAGLKLASRMSKYVHVIINPASGADRPILNTLNSVFHKGDIRWEVSLTKKTGDAQRFARQAAESGADIVAIYGGDGSVMEAASGLMGLDIPLAVFPGGTANVFSVELGIPQNLAKASALVMEGASRIRQVDMGRLNGEYLFILRLATGFEAEMTKQASRELKDRVGKLSYTVAGIMAIRSPLSARYKFTLDEQRQVEAEGISCMVANTGNLGLPGVNLAKGSDVSDGVLDVVVFDTAHRDSILSILDFSVFRSDEELRKDLDKLHISDHWQARHIIMETDPVRTVIIDGEVIGQTPCTIEVIPRAVNVLVPA
jgi:YegS/Rv2252/BmrU family lipid kinase